MYKLGVLAITVSVQKPPVMNMQPLLFITSVCGVSEWLYRNTLNADPRGLLRRRRDSCTLKEQR